jgi:hypothetical protein
MLVHVTLLAVLLGAAPGAVADMDAVKTPPTVTTDTLKRLLAAFNAHDLNAIMQFFTDDCELYMPRGKEPSGTHYVGKDAVREGLATRFAGIPDVHMARISTGSLATVRFPRGYSLVRPRRARRSAFGVLTFSSSATARSARRIPIGKSSTNEGRRYMSRNERASPNRAVERTETANSAVPARSRPSALGGTA